MTLCSVLSAGRPEIQVKCLRNDMVTIGEELALFRINHTIT